MTTSKIAPISIIIFLLIFANYLYDGMWLTPKETEEYIHQYINHPFMSKKLWIMCKMVESQRVMWMS